MAQPPEYKRQFGFRSFETNYPDTPLPGREADAEWNEHKQTTDAIRFNLAHIQRDDLRLKNLSVHPFALSYPVRMLMLTDWEPRGFWAPGTEYAYRDVIEHQGWAYIALESHTASADFVTDRTPGEEKWLSLGAADLSLTDIDGFPDYYGDPGQVLKVNARQTGLIWANDLEGAGGGNASPATYVVDPTNDNQSVAGNGSSLFDVIEAIGAGSGVALFQQWPDAEDAFGITRFTFKTGVVVPDNVYIAVMNGCKLRFQDNGIMVQGFGGFTVPDAPWVEDATVNGTGLWWPGGVRDTVPLTWWGATGKRSDNAVLALKGAANTIPGGGTIQAVPNGQYTIDQQMGVPSRLTIQGYEGSTFYCDTVEKRAFEAKESVGVVFDNWIFEGARSGLEGVKFKRCPDPVVRNCQTKNMKRLVRFSDCDYPIIDTATALDGSIDEIVRVQAGAKIMKFRELRADNGCQGAFLNIDTVGVSAAPWQPSTSYAEDDIVNSADRSIWLQCIVPGTSGTTEPNWLAAEDTSRIVEGGCVWELREQPQFADRLEIDGLYVRDLERRLDLRACKSIGLRNVYARGIGLINGDEFCRLEYSWNVAVTGLDVAGFVNTARLFKCKGVNNFVMTQSFVDGADDVVRTENLAAEGGPCTNFYVDASVIVTNLIGDVINNRDVTNNVNNVTDAKVW